MKDIKALQFALAKFATNLWLVVNLIVHFEQEKQLKIVVFTQEDFVNTKKNHNARQTSYSFGKLLWVLFNRIPN